MDGNYNRKRPVNAIPGRIARAKKSRVLSLRAGVIQAKGLPLDDY